MQKNLADIEQREREWMQRAELEITRKFESMQRRHEGERAALLEPANQNDRAADSVRRDFESARKAAQNRTKEQGKEAANGTGGERRLER